MICMLRLGELTHCWGLMRLLEDLWLWKLVLQTEQSFFFSWHAQVELTEKGGACAVAGGAIASQSV